MKLKIPTLLTDFPYHDGPALIGCSSFGFGGANAHIVMQEAPTPRRMRKIPCSDYGNKNSTIGASAQLLVISAASLAALKEHAHNWASFLLQTADSTKIFRDILYSAALRAHHHTHRLAVVAPTPQETASVLHDFHNDKVSKSLVSATVVGEETRRPLVFVYSGMGTQWWAMARQLIKEQPVFARKIGVSIFCVNFKTDE